MTEDQQALEDEGIILPIKPSIPHQMQARAPIHAMPQMANGMNFTATNQMISGANNQQMMPYAQNYFGNQAIATPGFIANNFPTTSNAMVTEPTGRRKSIIENINPFISEQKVLPMDLLSAFPVSQSIFSIFISAISILFHENMRILANFRKTCCMFV